MAEYDHGSIKVAADVMDESMEHIGNDLNKVKYVLMELYNKWQGDASISMRDVMQEWMTQENKLIEAMVAIRDMLYQSSNRIRIGEQERRALLNNSVGVTNYSSGLFTTK